MLWAAMSLCFFGFLCLREVVVPSDASFDPEVHLTASNVSVDSHASLSYVAVRIKASETDPFRQGVTIYLGRMDGHICLVAAILSYIVRRDSSPGSLFTFEDGRCLTRDCFISAIREALSASRIDASKYVGHSFRIGAVITAASKGIQDSLIKTMGQWESLAYTLYIHTPRDKAVASTLLK